MNIQAQILALLHGELKEGKELSELFGQLAISSEGQQEFLDQVAMSRHFSRLGDATIPSSQVDQQVLNTIAQRSKQYSVGQRFAKIPSQILSAGVVAGVICSFLAFFLGLSVGHYAQSPQNSQPSQNSDKENQKSTNPDFVELEHLGVSPTIDTVREIIQSNKLQSEVSKPEVKQKKWVAKPPKSWSYFDGENDVAIMPEVGLSIDSNYTIEMDVYVEDINQESWILGYSTPDESGDLLFGVKDGALRFLTYSLYEASNDILTAQVILPKTWYHVSYVQNTNEKVIQVYLNGELIAKTELQTLRPKSRVGTFYIGACNWYNTGRIDQFFQGGLSNIYIWNDAFDQESMGRKGHSKDKLHAYWPLSHISQDLKVVDMSENGYDGVAQGGLLLVESESN